MINKQSTLEALRTFADVFERRMVETVGTQRIGDAVFAAGAEQHQLELVQRAPLLHVTGRTSGTVIDDDARAELTV